jgi:fermentation-respiration switch protein FrsA (DUF1100 family)
VLEGDEMRDIVLEIDGLKILGQLHLPANSVPPHPAVILCHGIPTGNPADPDDGGYPELARQIASQGMAAFTFNFRGCGTSQGNFDIAGWSRDLEGVIDYIWNLEEIDDSRLALWGFSAGAAVSVYVAGEDKRVAAVSACACPSEFSSIYAAEKPRELIDYFRRIGIIREGDFPASLEDWLNGFRRVNALHSVSEIAPRPLLLVHGRQDGVVPLAHSQRLYEMAAQPKKLVIIEAAEHRLRLNRPAVDQVLRWLKKQLSAGPAGA